MSQRDYLRYLGQPPVDRNMPRFSYPGDNLQFQSTAFPSSSSSNSMRVAHVKKSDAPPPVPPRLHASSHPMSGLAPGRYNPLAMGYGMSPYSMGGYSSRGVPYAGYGAMGYGHNRYGYYGADTGNQDNLFIRMAEESSRPAFQSIESMVNAVGSISMMLESTYHAVYSSYRAVLGVVDQFSRLRSHLAHVLSTLALIRTLQWLCQKVLHLLGMRRSDPSAEAAWSAATTAVKNAGPNAPNPQTSWPIFMFMGLVFGAPWLIFRIFSKMASKKAEEIWSPTESVQRRVLALYDFHAAQAGELSVKQGQVLILAPKNLQPKTAGWSLVCADSQNTGFVPTSYIRRIVKKPPTTTASPPTVPHELSPVNEQIAAVSPEPVPVVMAETSESVSTDNTHSDKCGEMNEKEDTPEKVLF